MLAAGVVSPSPRLRKTNWDWDAAAVPGATVGTGFASLE
jgi:hypothetical protein